jgi:hypothetical protein
MSLPNITTKWAGASQQVVQAIQSASKRTGVSFDYLMDKAKQESSFNAKAKAGTSSASGLYQFIESTWLSAVKKYGDDFGLDNYADKISSDGKVADAATRREILKLRNNPEIASNMVAALTKDNADVLKNSIGGKVGETDLYMAHFLGLNGAEKFLKARQANPAQLAADIFPQAAKANKNVFYGEGGKKRSLEEVYDFFAAKMGEGDNVKTAVVTSRPSSFIPQESRSQVFNRLDAHIADALPESVSAKQISALQAIQWGHRQLLESLLSGVNNFGAQNTGNIVSNNLLSPYTAFVMSKLQTPGETS